MKVLSLASIISATGHHFSMTEAYKYISDNKNNLNVHSEDGVKLIQMPGTTIHMKFHRTDTIGIASYEHVEYNQYREYLRRSILPPDVFQFPEFNHVIELSQSNSQIEPYKQYSLLLFYIFDELGLYELDEIRDFLTSCLHEVDNPDQVYLEPFPSEISNKRKGALSFINGMSTGSYLAQLLSFAKHVMDDNSLVTYIFQYNYVDQLIPLLTRDELDELQHTLPTMRRALRNAQNYYIPEYEVSHYSELMGHIDELVTTRQTEIVKSQIVTVSKHELDNSPLLLEQLNQGARINIVIGKVIGTEAW